MRLIHTQTVCISLLIIGLTFTYARSGLTQVTGEVGEMDRLEQKAEDAIANGDPEGAALSIGKAALMANLLAQKEDVTRQIRLLYQAADTLFRGQEQGYRALALFERAGGQPPASQGVCQYLSQAADKVKQSQNDLKALADFTNESFRERQQRHIGKTQEWEGLLQGLQEDLSC
ncbi:MAG: hypothetical protein KC592_00425 [Nitrospira sp.]|nr:hypothetical protein [Nitrospira sp.]